MQGRPLEARCFTAPPLFIFHHANAFETAGGRRLIVDSIHYDSLPAVGREALAEQQASSTAAAVRRVWPCVCDEVQGRCRASHCF